MSAGVGTDGSKKWRIASILPFKALCKKVTMCAAYAAKKSGFGRAFGFEDLRDRAIE